MNAAQAFEFDFVGRESENVDCRHVVFRAKRSAVGSRLDAKVPWPEPPALESNATRVPHARSRDTDDAFAD